MIPEIFIEDAGERGGHEGFSQTDDVTEHDASAGFYMMRGDFYGFPLKLE